MNKICITTSSFDIDANPPLLGLAARGFEMHLNPHRKQLNEAQAIDFMRAHNPVAVIAGVEPWTAAVMDADRSRRLVDELAEAGVSWTTVAPRPIVRPSSTR